MPNQYVAIIEKMIGNFLWSGFIFRVKRNTLYRQLNEGGLGLINVKLKALALLTKTLYQSIQLPNGNMFAIMIKQWHSNMTAWVPAYLKNTHDELQNLFEEHSRVQDIYKNSLQVKDEVPTICLKYPEKPWTIVWKNIAMRFLTAAVRSLMFQVVHDIVTTKVKLNAIRLDDNTTCHECAKTDTLMHRVVDCRGHAVWRRMKEHLKRLNQFDNVAIPDEQLVTLSFEEAPVHRHNATVWFVANTVYFILEGSKTRIAEPTLWEIFMRQQRFAVGNAEVLKKTFGLYFRKISII